MHVIYSIMVFDNDAHPKCQTHELCSQFGSPGWCKMKQGIARWCKMVLPSFGKLVFCWCVQPSGLQVSATVVLCHVKLMSGVLSLEVREHMLCSGLCNSAATSIVYLFTSFLGSDVHILICTLNVRETSDDWQTGICNIWSMRPRHPRRPMPWNFGCRGIARWCEMMQDVKCVWELP